MVGVRRIGRRHAQLVAASPSTELAAIADPAPDTAELFVAFSGAAYGTAEEMLATERPDGVILATPTPSIATAQWPA